MQANYIVCGHVETKEDGIEGEGCRGVAVGSQEGCGRRAIVGVAPRLPWRLSARRPINSIPMATTDNIGHTPCRTTTLPFGHSVPSFHQTKGRRPKKSRGLRARNPIGRISFGTRPVIELSKAGVHLHTLLSPHCIFLPVLAPFPTFFFPSFHPYFRFSSRSPSRSARSLAPSSFPHRRFSHPSVSPFASLSCHSFDQHPFSEKALRTSLNEL